MINFIATVVQLETPTAPTMTSLLGDLATVVSSVFGWVGTVATTIVSTPILLLTTGFLVLGGTIGIFGRLLSRN